DRISLEVSIRENNSFKEIKDFSVWTSPRLDVRFDMTGDELVIYYPDGGRFLSPVELSNYAEQETQRAERERLLKEQERFLKEQEQIKYQTLLSQLKAKGIDINALESMK
ncbi:Uma2 family endonuclease, partial [Cylindrospermopsis raciborskii UAM/DH-BiRr]